MIDHTFSWFVFSTYSKAEKKAASQLQIEGFECFLPTRQELVVWKNRQRKLIDRILISGYIFVKTTKSQINKVLRLPTIVTYIHNNGCPSAVRQEEIDAIKAMINTNTVITVDNSFTINEKVMITSGPMAGYKGVIVAIKGKRHFGVILSEVQYAFCIDICDDMMIKEI